VNDSRSAPATAGRRAFVALVATLAIQVFTSLAATATAVLAPEIAQAFAIAPKWIGVFVGLVYAGAMLASLASGGFIERFGAIRVSQIGVVLCAAGTALIAVAPAGAEALLVVAALTIGLGYGPITPASSHVLIRTSPPGKLALTFSIKQTGVPAGAALAGAALPSLALVLGWRHALLIAAASGLAVRIEANELARYPPELEGAVYFCCRQALKVAAALGARPILRLWEADHALHFEIAESGGSSDLAESDLSELGDRVEALGGLLTIAPGPEGGTRLHAAIPVATSRSRPDRG